jgi:CubicO group peptidase (beta-lactamase class C family)
LVALFARKGGATYAQLVQRRVIGPAGMPKTTVDSTTGAFHSNVDELYRTELAHFAVSDSADNGNAPGSALGWRADRHRDHVRLAAYATRDGRRAAFVRYPARRVAILVLTNSDAIDARALAERIAEPLLGRR